MRSIPVRTTAELVSAAAHAGAEIEVEGTLTGVPSITLLPGTTLRGGTLVFGARGVRLTRDNTLDGVRLQAPKHEMAICNDPSYDDLGTLRLRDVTTRGQVLLLAEGAVREGAVHIDGLRVQAAHLWGREHRPHAFGVDALQGALTVWNRQDDPTAVLTAEILDVSAGSADEPVGGSGVFVGGRVEVSRLTTGEIHTHGGIPAGTPDLISGGVFVITGARVAEVVTRGPVTTYGQNDMVLDNWGTVDSWTVLAPITSHGPSGIGFVNFGDLTTLDVQAPIQTHGKGARGFNLYDGTLARARFASIRTTGDGSVGIQVSTPMGELEVMCDVSTSGGEGLSLVKGVQTPLAAAALSVKEGGRVDRVRVGGRLVTTGDDVVTVEIEGEVGRLDVAGGVWASGRGSDAVHAGPGAPDLADLEAVADHGRAIVR